MMLPYEAVLVVNTHIEFLFQAATFEVLLVRFACLFDPETNTMMFTNGKIFKRQPSQVNFYVPGSNDLGHTVDGLIFVGYQFSWFSWRV